MPATRSPTGQYVRTPVPAGRERVLEIVAEASQHLQLEVGVGEAQRAVGGDRVAHRAQVVRGDGQPQTGAGRPGLEQRDRQRLEVAVATRP